MVRGRRYDLFCFLGMMLGLRCRGRLFYLVGGVIVGLKSLTLQIPLTLSVT